MNRIFLTGRISRLSFIWTTSYLSLLFIYAQKENAPRIAGRFPQCVKKASQSSRPQARIKSKLFSAAARMWRKILLRLQVWNLSAKSGQIMRAADCKPFVGKARRVFRQSRALPQGRAFHLRTFCVLQKGYQHFCAKFHVFHRDIFQPAMVVFAAGA